MASQKRVLGTLSNGPVRRNLFGPVDPNQLQVEYQAAMQKDLEEASTRWGFDFILDKPLENSDFVWEGVPGTKVPLLYRSCMLDVGHSERVAEVAVLPKGGRVEQSQSEKENIPCLLERCPINVENLEKTPEKRGSAGVKRKQTNITGIHRIRSSLNDNVHNFMQLYMS